MSGQFVHCFVAAGTLGLWLGLAAARSQADEPAAPAAVSYHTRVWPILREHCQGCHQPAKAEGGLVVTSFAALRRGGESETDPVVPGKPDESPLVDQITPHDGTAAMPKGRPPLAPPQIELIRQWIAAGAADDTPAQVGPTIDQAHPPVYQSPPLVTALDYSPDGSLLAVSGYHEVLLFAGDGSALVARLVGLSERIESVAFSPDGQFLAVTGGSPARFGEVQVWHVAERQLRLSLPVTFDTIYGASWSPDGKLIAFGCGDNTLRAIEAESGRQVLFQGAHNDWVFDTVFSVDGSHLVSASRDRSLKLTEVATQRFVDNITSITPGALKGGLQAVDRHPGRDELLIGGSDGVPKLYQMHRTKARVIGDDFNLIREYGRMPGRVFDGDFNADGSRLVAGSSEDRAGYARVYQTDDAALVCELAGQKGPVYAVAFRPDGTQVASGGFDGLVRLSDAQTGALLREFVPVPLEAPAVASAP